MAGALRAMNPGFHLRESKKKRQPDMFG